MKVFLQEKYCNSIKEFWMLQLANRLQKHFFGVGFPLSSSTFILYHEKLREKWLWILYSTSIKCEFVV